MHLYKVYIHIGSFLNLFLQVVQKYISGDPRTLQNTMWTIMTMQFGLRSCTPHVNMLWGDVQLKLDEASGLEYLVFSERSTKTRTGQTSDARPFCPKAFASSGSYQLIE